MKLIDKQFDNILKVDYELYSLNFSELKELAKSWYGEIDFRQFNEDGKREKEYVDEEELNVVKKTGVFCNYFFAYKEEGKYYLLDGFNRLFTNYGEIKEDTTIYLKVIIGKLEDYELMKVMVNLNLWKLSNSGNQFHTNNFIDRGFRLFLFKRFGIKIYTYEDYDKRKRDKTDFDILDYYFRDEVSYAGYFKYSMKEIISLFSNKKIIFDLKEIIKSNDYLEKPFNHYDTFLQGYIMFLSRRRLIRDETDYKFKSFIEVLKKDKKFFNKLQNMSWTDSTRQNIYKFFKNIEQLNHKFGETQ